MSLWLIGPAVAACWCEGSPAMAWIAQVVASAVVASECPSFLTCAMACSTRIRREECALRRRSWISSYQSGGFLLNSTSGQRPRFAEGDVPGDSAASPCAGDGSRGRLSRG